MEFRKPNLLLLGFQRCGSSSLFDYLSDHPEIVGSTPKETFILSDSNYEHFDEKLSYFSNKNVFNLVYEEKSILSEKAYLLEGSVNNFYQINALKYVQENSDVKVIFLLRDPLERILSTFKYSGMNGINLPPNCSFEKYLQLIELGEVKKEILKYGIEHGKYGTYIKNWEKAISNDRIYLTSINKLKKGDDGLWSFLELSSLPPLKKVKNSSSNKMARFPLLNAFIHRYLSNLGLGNTFIAKVYSQLSRKSGNIEVSQTIKDELREIYSEEYKLYKHLF